MKVFVLYLYKKVNIVEKIGEIEVINGYEIVKTGELIFNSKKVALSAKEQLLSQRLFDKIELVEGKMWR